MNPRSLSLLILCNLIWSFHPILGKSALESFSPANAGLLRYGTGLLSYLLIAFAVQLRPEARKVEFFALPRNRKDAFYLFILGAAPFAFAPILQLTGLAGAQAIDNAVLIAMEPLMTVLLAWIVLRERLHLIQWLAFAGAMGGFLLLSRVQEVTIDASGMTSLLPYLLMLLSLWGEAAYSVFGRKLVQNYSPLPLYGSAILIGTVILSVYTWLDPRTGSLIEELKNAKAASLLSLLYLGSFGTTTSYLLWIRIARVTPVAIAVLTVFVQPVFGTILGYVLTDESFTLAQSAGALLILLSVALQSVWFLRGFRAN